MKNCHHQVRWSRDRRLILCNIWCVIGAILTPLSCWKFYGTITAAFSSTSQIEALFTEKEALRVEKHSGGELHKADRIHRDRRSFETGLVRFEEEAYDRLIEEYPLAGKEWIKDAEGGGRVEKDTKGRMSITVPKYFVK
jgi:hypothetical protein